MSTDHSPEVVRDLTGRSLGQMLKIPRETGGGRGGPQRIPALAERSVARATQSDQVQIPTAETHAIRMLVFDGDDTLWRTMVLYRKAKARFAALMAAHLSMDAHLTLSLLDGIDARNVSRLGFSSRRFPLSLVQSYEHLAQSAGSEIDTTLRRKVRAIGEAVFRHRAVPLRGAGALLRDLRASGLLLILQTKGSRRIQRRRLTSSGLHELFHRVYIVPDKSERTFARILKIHSVRPENACSVGDSVRSDINPALRIGMSAAWLPQDGWVYERENPIASTRLHTLKRLADLRTWLRHEEPRRHGR